MPNVALFNAAENHPGREKKLILPFLKNYKMNKAERPRVLEALCLLSFLGSGGAAALYFLAAVFFGKAKEYILEYSSMHTMESISPVYFLSLSLLFMASFYGVIRMWQLSRSGFFIYVLAQLIILLLPIFWLGTGAFSAVVLIFTLLFAGAYASQYKYLR
jgi:hypothetical protein